MLTKYKIKKQNHLNDGMNAFMCIDRQNQTGYIRCIFQFASKWCGNLPLSFEALTVSIRSKPHDAGTNRPVVSLWAFAVQLPVVRQFNRPFPNLGRHHYYLCTIRRWRRKYIFHLLCLFNSFFFVRMWVLINVVIPVSVSLSEPIHFCSPSSFHRNCLVLQLTVFECFQA